jgi:hypothetical protein
VELAGFLGGGQSDLDQVERADERVVDAVPALASLWTARASMTRTASFSRRRSSSAMISP